MDRFKKITGFFLATWMFLVSSGFTVTFHLCEGEIKSWNLFEEAPGCGHYQLVKEHNCCSKQISPSLNEVKNDSTVKGNCCSTTSKIIKIEENTIQNNLVFKFFSPIFLLTFLPNFTANFNVNTTLTQLTSKLKIPPLLVSETLSLIQCFRL